MNLDFFFIKTPDLATLHIMKQQERTINKPKTLLNAKRNQHERRKVYVSVSVKRMS